jgi:hypothetical protein
MLSSLRSDMDNCLRNHPRTFDFGVYYEIAILECITLELSCVL